MGPKGLMSSRKSESEHEKARLRRKSRPVSRMVSLGCKNEYEWDTSQFRHWEDFAKKDARPGLRPRLRAWTMCRP